MTCRGHFTTTNPASISSTEINISSSEKRRYGISKGKTPLVDGKLETLQWEKISNGNPI